MEVEVLVMVVVEGGTGGEEEGGEIAGSKTHRSLHLPVQYQQQLHRQ
jgi:hypothetical protein